MIHWSLIWHNVPVCQIGLPLSFVFLSKGKLLLLLEFAREYSPGFKEYSPGFKFIPIFVKKQQKKVSKNSNRFNQQSAKITQNTGYICPKCLKIRQFNK